jgi:hypothetical protein
MKKLKSLQPTSAANSTAAADLAAARSRYLIRLGVGDSEELSSLFSDEIEQVLGEARFLRDEQSVRRALVFYQAGSSDAA